jgi:hypothetical protein
MFNPEDGQLGPKYVVCVLEQLNVHTEMVLCCTVI